MTNETTYLPEIFIDSHCHARDMEQRYKTNLITTLSEAQNSLITTSVFKPNTVPATTNIKVLNYHIALIRHAQRRLNIRHPQYVSFGITDFNLDECEEALKYHEVPELKDFPKGEDGKLVTTSTIGVSQRKTRLAGLKMTRKRNKVYTRHCDNPRVIAREGNTINAEVTDVEDMISIASEVPGAKIIICHVSCRESAELILKAQKRGLQIIIELCPHYLWFDADGTNWNPDLDPAFYKCFNNLRSGDHREFLVSLLSTDNHLIIIGSDNAVHTEYEKIEKKLGGLPSNQEMVPVICTLAKKLKLTDRRVGELLSWNAGKVLGIRTSQKLVPYTLEEKIDDLTYNHGKIVNPWNGSRLLFPTPT